MPIRIKTLNNGEGYPPDNIDAQIDQLMRIQRLEGLWHHRISYWISNRIENTYLRVKALFRRIKGLWA